MTLIKKIVIPIGITLLSTMANTESEYKKNIKVEELEKIFANYGELGSDENQQPSSKRAFLLQKSLSPEDIILNELKKGNKKVVTNVKDDLEFLVSSVEGKEFVSDSDKSIGAFDKEKFTSTWKELQSLVDSSENSVAKQRVLQMELQDLVLSASSAFKAKGTRTGAANDMMEVENRVKATLDSSIKKIELIDAHEDWIEIKIERGDSLSTLAKKYYGNSTKYMVIYNANIDKINSNYVIHVGDTLHIPTANLIQGI